VAGVEATVTPTLDLQPGQTVHVQITKYLAYDVTHDGWGLRITTTRGPMVVQHQPDGSLSIGSAGQPEDDEV
jgi:hypothetical protein